MPTLYIFTGFGIYIPSIIIIIFFYFYNAVLRLGKSLLNTSFALVMLHNLVSGIAVIDHATTFAVLLFYAGIQREQAKQLKQKEAELTAARVDVMLSQIQPHFLYNTLAAIEAFLYCITFFPKAQNFFAGLITYSRELNGGGKNYTLFT